VATQTRRAGALLAAGHRVKVVVALDRAERTNPAAARALLDAVVRDLGPAGRPDGRPVNEKGALAIVVSPAP
jgi:hypothetical protein